MNNNMNNINNSNNGGNMNNSNKNKIIMMIIIGVVIIAAVFACIKFFGGNDTSGSGGSSSKGTSFSATQNINQNGNTGTLTADVVFADNGYETTIYYKMVVNYKEMNDEKMLSILKKLDPYGGTQMSPNYENFNVNGTTELGMVDSMGLDTTIIREGNKVTYTYYQSNYNNYQKMTASDKEAVKKSLEDQGFTIK